MGTNIYCQCLFIKKSLKLLALTISHDLSWTIHISNVDPSWYMQRGIRPISRFGKRQNLDWAALPRRLQPLQSVNSRANPGWVESRLVKRISNRLGQMLYSS
uniref:Uncharacterized protein n=1 Tax=Eptatretus burgeri TaxID=7764 RepID=A0A8C4Q448_EPTBU